MDGWMDTYHQPAVDPHGARLELESDSLRSFDITSPYRSRQAVLDRVGPVDDLLLIGEGIDAHHGAKDLLLLHTCVVREARDDRRLDKVTTGKLALELGTATSKGNRATYQRSYQCELAQSINQSIIRHTLLTSEVNVRQHLGHVIGTHESSNSGLGVLGIANDKLARLLHESLDELGVVRLVHEDNSCTKIRELHRQISPWFEKAD